MSKHEHVAVGVVETVSPSPSSAHLAASTPFFTITSTLHNYITTNSAILRMNINVNDNPLLVAPRPVRLTTPYPHFTRSLRIAPPPPDRPSDEAENIDDSKHASRIQSVQPPDKDTSPRASPRSSLPSEALEEFLSILRPAIFPPSSPVLRPRRNGALSLPTFGVAYRSKSKIDSSFTKSEQSSLSLTEETDPLRQTPTCSPEPISEHLAGNWDIFGPEITSRWHAQVLASPISRMQTRNPFPRHAAHDITLSPIRSSPTMASTPTSPAAVPLPVPSPDETVEVF
ncbi:hypothetical protein J3R82DRAFT_5428 [Butyriboletus roseoflavus]|nr:hypothetical protein J3R82DRAFT_5428 [Butyriboletus roseoflavus]